jgi:hypothetical protein
MPAHSTVRYALEARTVLQTTKLPTPTRNLEKIIAVREKVFSRRREYTRPQYPTQGEFRIATRF